MKYPQYLESKANELITKWHNDINLIIKIEHSIIEKNLKALYSDYDVMNVEIMVSPLLQFHSIDSNESSSKEIVFLPRYLATESLELYWAELNGVDSFLISLAKYGENISGKEIFEDISKNSDSKNQKLYDRINTVIRKFLSYQYVVANPSLEPKIESKK